MNYLSICSGIEAATVAWHPLGWTPVGFSEIEPFPCAALAHHYPTVPNFGDMTRFKEWPDANVDLLVGGTPCQAFSVAGLRKGLADPRGNLTLTFLAIAARYRPRWVVWENVPGVFSDDTGAFGSLLGGLAELGYMGCYRVLDAQYFGVAQRRRRPFVVGHLGDWRRAAAVLLERESLSGNPAPSREAGQRVANSLVDRPDRGGGNSEGQRLIAHALKGEGFDASEDGTGRGTPIVPDIAMCLNAGGMGRIDSETETMVPMAFSCKDHGADVGELSPTLRSMGHHGSHANAGGQVAVAFNWNQSGNTALGMGLEGVPPVRTKDSLAVYHGAMRVRRLTPRECERLQGFPDDYTLVPYRGKPAADGPRYKALGNSMAVPVMRWIGQRIATSPT